MTMNSTFADMPTAAWKLADEATVLVRRYPDISHSEAERLVEIYPKLPIVQIAMMSSDEELAPRLEAFRKDHARRLRVPVRHIAALLSPLILLAIIVAWMLIQ
jgi:hypothetical protein